MAEVFPIIRITPVEEVPDEEIQKLKNQPVLGEFRYYDGVISLIADLKKFTPFALNDEMKNKIAYQNGVHSENIANIIKLYSQIVSKNAPNMFFTNYQFNILNVDFFNEAYSKRNWDALKIFPEAVKTSCLDMLHLLYNISKMPDHGSKLNFVVLPETVAKHLQSFNSCFPSHNLKETVKSWDKELTRSDRTH